MLLKIGTDERYRLPSTDISRRIGKVEHCSESPQHRAAGAGGRSRCRNSCLAAGAFSARLAPELQYSDPETVTGKSESPGSGQLLKQRLRLDEIARVEALGEPAVDGRQQLAGLGGTALLAQQPR